ncbi:zinc ABC transporter substrate-binding protein [Aestuariivirga sp.]|uniref:zinc ABC transporter substrate-binding protein n=1 Tax=Aestuariivirga sp. TaxID=2650926 RepID=UPI0039E58E3F
MRRFSLLACSALFLWPAATLASPTVITSIVPVYSIVSAVMGDTGKPQLLLKGRLSEHTAALTPEQIDALGKADLVFTVDDGLEFKLGELDGTEAVNGKHFTQLSHSAGVKVLPVREGGAWEPDTDEPQPTNASNTDLVLKYDPHIWLDPENAKAMAFGAAAALAKEDPANAAAYDANAKAFAATLDSVSAEIKTELAPVKDKPFIVFHDAYHYFENRFGVHAVGSISDVSATSPSAQRLAELRAKLKETGAACVFREPQFQDKYVQAIVEGSPAKSGVLDGLGADLEPGPGAYAQILKKLASSLTACLSG